MSPETVFHRYTRSRFTWRLTRLRSKKLIQSGNKWLSTCPRPSSFGFTVIRSDCPGPWTEPGIHCCRKAVAVITDTGLTGQWRTSGNIFQGPASSSCHCGEPTTTGSYCCTLSVSDCLRRSADLTYSVQVRDHRTDTTCMCSGCSVIDTAVKRVLTSPPA